MGAWGVERTWGKGSLGSGVNTRRRVFKTRGEEYAHGYPRRAHGITPNVRPVPAQSFAFPSLTLWVRLIVAEIG